MMEKIFSLARGSRGQNIVEFALVAPVLLAFLLGCIVFGNMFYQKLLASEAARATARAVAVCGDRTDSAVVAAETAFGPIVSAQISPTPMVANNTVTVQITKTVYIPYFIARYLDQSSLTITTSKDAKGKVTTTYGLNITGSATMLLERAPIN